jgi:tetratricopeptide (TPR) repeat protein/ribosomal protein S18 acetylase RimI-like enzyme
MTLYLDRSHLNKIMRLIDLFEARFQEIVHENPSVGTLKALARNNKYHSARFVITKSGDVYAADSLHYTHHSMAPFDGAWEVRGYVQYMDDGSYLYRSMQVYSALNKDHPILRTWERGGIQNGNPDQSHLNQDNLQESASWEHLLSLDPHTFDQTSQGWRSLVYVGDMPQAIEALQGYIQKYVHNGVFVDAPKGTKTIHPQILIWHLGQMLAMENKYEQAIKWMKQSFIQDDPQWNDYVKATVAFLQGNQQQLDQYKNKANENSKTIDRLVAGFGKPYSQVYEHTESISELSETPIKATISTHPDHMGATVQEPHKIQEPVVLLPANKILVLEPDTKFDDPEHALNLRRITAAIKKGAKLPAILVRRLGMKYQVVDGHHRFRAYRDLNIKLIPARIIQPNNITIDNPSSNPDLHESYHSSMLPPQLYVPHPSKLTENIKPKALVCTNTAIKLADCYSSAWVEWCAHAQPDWLSDQGPLFDVKPGDRIFTLNTDNQAMAIAEKDGVKINHTLDLFRLMPWDLISRDYDAENHVPFSDRYTNLFMSTWERGGIQNGNPDQSHLSEHVVQDVLVSRPQIDLFRHTDLTLDDQVQVEKLQDDVDGLVIYKNNQVAAYLLVQHYQGHAWMLEAQTAPQYRRQGLNALLMDSAVKKYGRVFADMDLTPHSVMALESYVSRTPYKVYRFDTVSGDLWDYNPANPEDQMTPMYDRWTLGVKRPPHSQAGKFVWAFSTEKPRHPLLQGYMRNLGDVQPPSTTMTEAWSAKYKRSINCEDPKGFSQRAHFAARKNRQLGRNTLSKAVK